MIPSHIHTITYATYFIPHTIVDVNVNVNVKEKIGVGV